MARNDDDPDAPRPTNDAFTGMLAISLIALIVGATLLYLDYSQFPESAPKKPVPKAPGANLQPGPAAEKKADDGAKKADDAAKKDDAKKDEKKDELKKDDGK